MKNGVLIVIAILGLSSLSFAQQAELTSAGANIEKKDYIAALDDLNKAKKKVTDLMVGQLSTVLPAKFGELVMQDNNEMGMMGGSEGMSLYKTFAKPQAESNENTEGGDETEDGMMDNGMMDPTGMRMMGQEQVVVQITTNMMMASEVMNAHSMSDEGMGSAGVKAVRVKGYRAILRSSEDGMGGNSDEAQAIVGGAFISVQAQGLKEKGQAEKFLNLIDFDKLKLIVGE